MKAVGVFDLTITALREHRFSKDEATQLIDEFRLAYPDVFEQVGLEGNFPSDFAERLPDTENFDDRMADTESVVESEEEDL
jgi:hypothetical protein